MLAVALLFQSVTFGIGFYSFTFFVGPWMEEFGASRGSLVTAMTAATLAIGVFGPFVGRALDRGSIRVFVCMGGVLFAGALALVSFAESALHIILIYALLVGAALVLTGNLSAQTLVVKWFRARRGMAIGLVSAGSSIGGFVMPPLSTWLIKTFGWRGAALVLAALTLVLILPTVWLVVRNSPEDKGVEPEPDSDRSRTLASRHVNQLWTTAEIMKERTFWVMVVAFTPAATAFSAVQHNLGPYTADLGIAPQQASFLMSVIALSMVGGKTVFGALADRIDNRFLFWVAAGFNVAGLLILGTEPPYLLLLLSAVFMGIAVGGNMPLTGSIISQHFGPEAFGRVLGLLLPFLTLSSVGPVIAARLRDQAGSYSPAFHLLLGFLVPAVLGMALLPKPESGKTRARSL